MERLIFLLGEPALWLLCGVPGYGWILAYAQGEWHGNIWLDRCFAVFTFAAGPVGFAALILVALLLRREWPWKHGFRWR